MIYSLFVVLLVLLFDHLAADRGGLDPFSWLEDWVQSVEQRFNGGEVRQGAAALALTVGSVFVVTLLIQAILAGMGWPFRLGFDLLLLYFFVQVSQKISAARNVVEAMANDDRGRIDEALAGLPPTVDEAATDVETASVATARLLACLNNWFFAPVFWYLLFGPAGAALFYTAGVTALAWNPRQPRFQEFGRAANLLHRTLSWIPVRILAIGYALVGDFEHALHAWKQQVDTWTGSNDQLLVTIGLGALGATDENHVADKELVQRAIALSYRVVIFWVVLGIAIGVIGLVV